MGWGSEDTGNGIGKGKRGGNRKSKKENKDRKWIEAKPFMTPAYEQEKEAAVNIIINTIKMGLNL